MKALALLSFTLLACSGAQRTTAVTQSTTATTAVSAPGTRPSTAMPCEESYALSQQRPYGLLDQDTSCTFPEGNCQPVRPAQCGGVERDESPGTHVSWACTPADPTVLRDNGCPYTVPEQGSACARESLRCDFGPCPWNNTFSICTSGRWVVDSRMTEAPPK